MLRSVKSPQRMPRMLSFKVNGLATAGIIIGSKDATLADDGTGAYTLTFKQPFARVPVVVATSETAGVYCEVIPAAASVQVFCKATDGTQADTDAIFHVMVLGHDVVDEY